MRTGLNNNNKGLSMMELVVVIAILAVMVSGTLFTFGVVNNAKNKRVIQSVATGLGRTKVNCMAKGESGTYMLFKKSADGYWVETYINGSCNESENVAPKSITVKYDAGSGESEMAEGDSITVKFKHGSGTVADDPVESTGFKTITAGDYSISLYKETGKYQIERN